MSEAHSGVAEIECVHELALLEAVERRLLKPPLQPLPRLLVAVIASAPYKALREQTGLVGSKLELALGVFQFPVSQFRAAIVGLVERPVSVRYWLHCPLGPDERPPTGLAVPEQFRN